ncbi:PIG-P-domain-containing protein [Trametes elegans]|nr:PIG-P-domain-containing protein [Trametes elegans]
MPLSEAHMPGPPSESEPESEQSSEYAAGQGADAGWAYAQGQGENDTALNEPTSPTSPLAPYPPILPTETRSRAPEFYGFVAWAGTYLLFVLYLLWALLPDAAIRALGVTWYPNREWALLIPAYGMVLVLLTYFTYFALALAGTPAFADMRTITDSKAHLPDAATRAQPAPYLAHARPDAPPEMYDIPLGLVNRVVFRRRPRTRTGRGPPPPAAAPGAAAAEPLRAASAPTGASTTPPPA